MCLVSAVLDYGQKTIPINPEFQPWPFPSVSPIKSPEVKPVPFDYNAYVAYAELLRKAAAYDKLMNEPHCEDPKKVEFLKDLMKRMDVLGDEFKKISQQIQEIFNETTT